MNTRVITHKNLNGGKPFEFKYVITEDELDNQVFEILDNEEYAHGKKEGGVYIDLGANTGMATLYFSQFAKQVYSVEPNPKIYETLVENTKHLKNVKTFNLAWYCSDNPELLYSENGKYQAQTMFARNQYSSGIRVECRKPSTFFKENNIDHVDVMKVDIEESEYIIFPDDDFGLVASKIDTIIGEGHYQANGGFPDLIPHLLGRWGYKTEFAKLSKPNYFQTFTYRNYITNQKLDVQVPRSTIFVAKRK